MLYESALVGAFNYLWGHHDARSSKPPSLSILSNAQNPLDELLGDMVGRVEGRYFLIEFKRTKSGFSAEVHAAKAKPARNNLYKHLRADPECRKFARYGHFAAWSDGVLRIAPYAHTVGPGARAGTPRHELDYASFEADFDKFYASINCPDLSPFQQDASLYGHGLGLPSDSMHNYLECMLAQFPEVVAPAAEVNAIFGFWNPTTATVVAVPTSFEGLLGAFEEVKRLTQMQAPPSRPRGNRP